jgi:hypothetical protein
MSERDSESIASIEVFQDLPENPLDREEEDRIENVRERIKTWKLRELKNNTGFNQKPNGLDPLRKFVTKSARLFYDLQEYIATSQNKDENLKDNLYMMIITAIGPPGSLSVHGRTLLQSFMERDLLELPLTVEPKIVNSYTKKGLRLNANFPEDE